MSTTDEEIPWKWLKMVMTSHVCKLKQMAEAHKGMESQIVIVTEDMEFVDKHNDGMNTRDF